MADYEYEEWDHISGVLSEWLNDEYIDINELTHFVVTEFLKEINQGAQIYQIHLAQDIYNLLIPFPSGVGVGVVIPAHEIEPFDRELQRAFSRDYDIIQGYPENPSD